MTKLFTVEELAQATHITPRAVRLYVERGLLTPLRAGRTLCFTPADIVHLQDILRAKRLGFSLAEIHQFYAHPEKIDLNARVQRIRQIKIDADLELAALDRHIQARR